MNRRRNPLTRKLSNGKFKVYTENVIEEIRRRRAAAEMALDTPVFEPTPDDVEDEFRALTAGKLKNPKEETEEYEC